MRDTIVIDGELSLTLNGVAEGSLILHGEAEGSLLLNEQGEGEVVTVIDKEHPPYNGEVE